MNNIKNEKDLIETLSANIEDEELLLLTLQGMISAEISMKRQELKISQKDFAKKMGVTQSLVSRWENGDTNYTLSTLVKICSFLGLNMQSPIIPRPAKIYPTKNSNIYAFPGAGSWNAKNTIVETGGLNTFNYEELEEM